jgi:hypothetical protein
MEEIKPKGSVKYLGIRMNQPMTLEGGGREGQKNGGLAKQSNVNAACQ